MGSLARKIARGLLRKRRASSSVPELFKRGEQGLWLDPSDLSTLFQDTAGAVPVTGPGQTVALAREKSGRGNHFIQPTALSRPTLGRHPVGGRRNLALQTNCAMPNWAVDGTSPPAYEITAHLGRPCVAITFPAGLTAAGWNGSRAVYQWSFAASWPNTSIARYLVSTNRPLVSGEYFSLMFNGWAAVCSTNVTFSDQGNVSSQWVERTATSIYNTTTSGSIAPVVTGGTTVSEPLIVYLTDVQYEIGATSTPYQKVTSRWDVTEAGKADCWYLGFDGVDDFMSSVQTVDLSASDKLTMWAGLEKLSDAATGIFFETSPSAISTSYPGCAGWVIPSISGATGVGFNVRGSATIGGRIGAWVPAPARGVLSCAYDIAGAGQADEIKPRVNGSVPAQTSAGAPSGTGNFGNYTACLGRRIEGGLHFNGRCYGLVVRGGPSDDATIAAVEDYLGPKIGLAAPVISITSGSGYAGSTLTADNAPGQWYANGAAIPGATDQTITVTLDLEEADITYKWLGLSSLPFRMWTPARAGITSVFDARRLNALSTDWQSADGTLRYTQPNAPTRPVYEAEGLAGGPCMFSDWNKSWVIDGLSPAPGARTMIGLFALIATDPANPVTQISNSQPGAWGLIKSWVSAGKNALWLNRTVGANDVQGSGHLITPGVPCLFSAKTKRPSGEYSFRVDGAPAGSGSSAVSSFTDAGGTYTMGGYIRLGSHAYVDSFMSLDGEINFEGWCAWTSGQQTLLAADHPRKAAPLRIS